MLRSASRALSLLFLMAMGAAPVFADDGSGEVSVGVIGMSLFTLPSASTLSLTAATPDSTDGLVGSTSQADAFVFGHNSANGLRITVTAAPDLLNRPNDISLKLTLHDLAAQTCVDRGTPLTDVALPASLPPGGGIGDLRWTADATPDATPSGSYAWLITITSTDM